MSEFVSRVRALGSSELKEELYKAMPENFRVKFWDSNNSVADLEKEALFNNYLSTGDKYVKKSDRVEKYSDKPNREEMIDAIREKVSKEVSHELSNDGFLSFDGSVDLTRDCVSIIKLNFLGAACDYFNADLRFLSCLYSDAGRDEVTYQVDSSFLEYLLKDDVFILGTIYKFVEGYSYRDSLYVMSKIFHSDNSVVSLFTELGDLVDD